jgi:hypothetical protein
VIKNDSTKSTKIPSYWTGLLNYEKLELISNCLDKEEPIRDDKVFDKEELISNDVILEKIT